MSMRRHPGLAAGFAACLLLIAATPGVASAQDQATKAPTKAERQAARDAYDKGTVAFEKGDYVTALDHFVKANAIISSVQALFWIARAQDKLGHTEAAIEAYDAITARADFSKLSEDKAATVRERLAALKASIAPPPPAPPLQLPEPEPVQPAVTEPPPPAAFSPPLPISPPPPLPADSDVLPQKNTAELGLMGGAMLLSSSHNLVEGSAPQRELELPVWQVGVRAAFFPEKVFGIEAEWAHGFGTVEAVDGPNGQDVQLDAIRGHLIGQLPSSRFVPFALLGAGVLRADSSYSEDIGAGESRPEAMGADTDLLLEAGVGFKVMASKIVVPRLDLRLNMTQAEGGGFADGIALHPEILLGLSFTLGR